MSYEERLRTRLLLLKKYIEEGKVKFPENLRDELTESLEKAKFDEKGNIDLDSVDSRLRSLALAVEGMDYEQQLQQTPLIQTQREYISIVETYFGEIYNEMIKAGTSPNKFAHFLATKENIVDQYRSNAEEFESAIISFWEYAFPIVSSHLRMSNLNNATYGGDIFPPYQSGILSSAGLIMDTVVLPCPILRASSFHRHAPIDRAFYMMVKHALGVLELKEVILAEVDPPIAIVMADDYFLNENKQAYLKIAGELDTATHIGKAVEKDFANLKDCSEFLKQFNHDNFSEVLIRPELLIHDTDWEHLNYQEQCKLNRDEMLRKLGIDLDKFPFENQVIMQVLGRMMQAGDLAAKAAQICSMPLIEAPTSWKYFLWKYEIDQSMSKQVLPDLSNLLIVNALQDEKLHWLGNIPIEALIKMRKQGEMAELREKIRDGVNSISSAPEEAFEETTNQVISNFKGILKDHHDTVTDWSSSGKKFLGYDVGSWVVGGGLTIAAAATGQLPLAIGAAVIGMVGVTNLNDLWEQGKSLIDEKKRIDRAPSAILIRASKVK